jgi:hypothetical protein
MPKTQDSTTEQSVSEGRKVEFVHQHIREALFDGPEDRWDEALSDWDTTRANREAVKAYVSGLRNRAWQSLRDIGSVDELERGLVIQYLELKSRWTMLNIQIQNQTRRQQEPDGRLLYRATCVSLLVEALEPLLTQERVDALADVLAEPMEAASGPQL